MGIVPWEEWVLPVKSIGQETRRTKIDGDRARVNRREVLRQKPIFQ